MSFISLFETFIPRDLLSSVQNQKEHRVSDVLDNLKNKEGWTYLGGNFFEVVKNETAVMVELQKGFGNSIRLSYIGVDQHSRGKGAASAVIADIASEASSLGVFVNASVDPQGKGGLNKKQLHQWYARKGFKRLAYRMEPDKASDDILLPPNTNL